MDKEKQERLKNVNDLVKLISSLGRGFFGYKDRTAQMEIDGLGHIYWVDDYTQKKIYTHYRGVWRGFSHGGTLKGLVENFRDYVSKNKKLPSNVFGPWPEWVCGGDLWGYGKETMEPIRAMAITRGMISYNH